MQLTSHCEGGSSICPDGFFPLCIKGNQVHTSIAIFFLVNLTLYHDEDEDVWLVILSARGLVLRLFTSLLVAFSVLVRESSLWKY